mgnify:CR=1 FL=1
MLEKVKLALRITTDAFDSEIQDLIDAALADLGIAGVTPDHYDKLKYSYDEQKAQLQVATGYTNWGE